MAVKPFRWLGKNLSTLVLAFFVALVVWVSAVLSADPNERRVLTRPVQIKIVGKDPDLKIMGSYTENATLTLIAPHSIWERLENEESAIQAWVDLSSLGEGEHVVPVQVQVNVSLARLVEQEPKELNLNLEPLVSQVFPITLVIEGDPPLGYQAEPPLAEPAQATVLGPVSLVTKVKELRAFLNISGLSETITRTLTLTPLDSDNKVVGGITLSPNVVSVTQPINLLGGYRNVIVKVVTTGSVASGYRLTNYFVLPASVVVFSSNPGLVNALPGYVETKPLDLTGKEDDFEALLELDLPPGVVAVTDTRVLVQVSVAAIESSLTISLPLEIVGLAPGLQAQPAPTTVDVILSGPVPILNDLKPGDIRAKVDLSGYDECIYQILPEVDFLPPRVQRVSILPATVEVTVSIMPTMTPTLTPFGTPTQTVTPQP